MSNVNTTLFLQIAERIEEKPELYNQALISCRTECGTAYCIGGWAMFLSYGETYCALISEPDESLGEIKSARELLGLDFDSADMLFVGSWKPRPGLTVPEALREIANGKSVSEVSA